MLLLPESAQLDFQTSLFIKKRSVFKGWKLCGSIYPWVKFYFPSFVSTYWLSYIMIPYHWISSYPLSPNRYWNYKQCWFISVAHLGEVRGRHWPSFTFKPKLKLTDALFTSQGHSPCLNSRSESVTCYIKWSLNSGDNLIVTSPLNKSNW